MSPPQHRRELYLSNNPLTRPHPLEPGLLRKNWPITTPDPIRALLFIDIDTFREKTHVLRYCWRIYFKVLEVLFLGSVSHAFLPSKKAWGIHKFRHFCIRQQYL